MAKKETSVFFCSNCGYESPRWVGVCPACHEWNTMTEVVSGGKDRSRRKEISEARPIALSEISSFSEKRISTDMAELNRVLGGGIVEGSLILIGGDPGIGKSTLLLQTARNISSDGKQVIYVSGEESAHQISLRAKRIGDFSDNMRILTETDLDAIVEILRREKPAVAVIDSIQTMVNEDGSGAAGSISQVRASTAKLMQLAKSENIAVFIVGHVTKEGTVAGPRVLEHMVDCVLYFEGDRHASYRIIRAVKNRFGSTDEIGVFEMKSQGLNEVSNPSEFMLEGRPKGSSGSVIACTIEGSRPILFEIQALTTRSSFGMPRRTAVGMDYNRVNLIMAVIEKRMGLSMADFDAYVNIAGGLRISEPSCDLGLVIALVSSFKNRPVADDLMAFGEVGLSGEVRSVSMPGKRVYEAAKMGVRTIVLPESAVGSIENVPDGVELVGVRGIREACDKVV
ncbi:DNA repair protein RadA [Candidatus Weimeria sp. HCP3S3_B5]|uniref:DNA repair protein RadA n=1 Tax=Candidatus Weimeria sp. HCP3S3_B5 TaxID=3438871 RepID=UPI002A9FCF27|nr:DNA repair protein RadA [Lachnospiraceae bacterium]MDY6351639.1 DNA repair protein RadA [Lachnospiraceae bacterium]